MSTIPKIALLLETSRGYGRGLLRGIVRYSRLHGPWALVVSAGHFGEQLPRGDWWGARGIITRFSSLKVARQIQAAKIPAVSLEASFEKFASAHFSHGLCQVRSDSPAIALMAASHLLERGFRHFGYCGLTDCSWSNVREEVFLRTIAEAGCCCEVYRAGHHRQHGRQERKQTTLVQWLQMLPKPVGILACNDDRGNRVLEACATARLHVPDDVAVVGVDNDELLCELSTPPLSSIDLNLESAGYEAAALLDGLMSGRVRGYHEVSVTPRQVLERRSTDVVAQEDRIVAAALRFIRDHASHSIQVPDVVMHTGLSRRALERRFAAAVGRTILEEITHCRLDRAKRLLLETDLSVERVATAAGFSMPRRMTHAFRQFEGTLPHHFRQKHRSPGTGFGSSPR